MEDGEGVSTVEGPEPQIGIPDSGARFDGGGRAAVPAESEAHAPPDRSELQLVPRAGPDDRAIHLVEPGQGNDFGRHTARDREPVG